MEMHCVNIVVKTDDTGSVYFDGGLLPPSCFLPVNGNNAYSYARMDIAHGVHRISCDKGFNAHVYGFGDAKGYAYLAGSNANRLGATVSVNGETVLPHEDYPFCPDREMTFRADVSHNHYNLLWDFGDGDTSTENPAVHTYAGRRLYNATLLVATDEGGCWDSPGDTVRFNIDATQHYSIHDEDVCEGGLYTGYGFNDIPIGNDTVLAGLQDNPVHPECQDSVLVYITARHHVTSEFDTVLCGALVWDGSTYTEAGDIVHTYPASNGCDSIVTCHLTRPEAPVLGDTLVMDTCNAFLWNGTEYPETGFYQSSLVSQTGCDSIAFLDLTLSHTPAPKIRCATPEAIVFGPDADTVAVVTNTEFFSFQYDFYVEDGYGHFGDWDSCAWGISKPSWAIEPYDDEAEPNRHYCRVYAAEHTDTLVVLTARAVNYSCVENERTAVCYLKPSFLDVGEHQAGFATIHPNPTTGKVTVTGESLQQVDVLNILGQRVLSIQGKGNELQLDLSRLPAGVYTLRVTMEDGSVYSDKVVKE